MRVHGVFLVDPKKLVADLSFQQFDTSVAELLRLLLDRLVKA